MIKSKINRWRYVDPAIKKELKSWYHVFEGREIHKTNNWTTTEIYSIFILDVSEQYNDEEYHVAWFPEFKRALVALTGSNDLDFTEAESPEEAVTKYIEGQCFVMLYDEENDYGI